MIKQKPVSKINSSTDIEMRLFVEHLMNRWFPRFMVLEGKAITAKGDIYASFVGWCEKKDRVIPTSKAVHAWIRSTQNVMDWRSKNRLCFAGVRFKTADELVIDEAARQAAKVDQNETTG